MTTSDKICTLTIKFDESLAKSNLLSCSSHKQATSTQARRCSKFIKGHSTLQTDRRTDGILTYSSSESGVPGQKRVLLAACHKCDTLEVFEILTKEWRCKLQNEPTYVTIHNSHSLVILGLWRLSHTGIKTRRINAAKTQARHWTVF